jgi:hypothetical protein
MRQGEHRSIDRSVIDVLLGMLSSSDERDVCGAAQALSWAPEFRERILPELYRAAAEPIGRWAVLLALLRFGADDEQAMTIAIDSLEHDDSAARRLAARLLCKAPPSTSRALPRLYRRVADAHEDEDVRRAAASALARIPGDREFSAKALRAMLELPRGSAHDASARIHAMGCVAARSPDSEPTDACDALAARLSSDDELAVAAACARARIALARGDFVGLATHVEEVRAAVVSEREILGSDERWSGSVDRGLLDTAVELVRQDVAGIPRTMVVEALEFVRDHGEVANVWATQQLARLR